MKRKKKLIQFIIKKGLMIIWTGNSIYVLMIFALMSCKSDNHWELPSDSSSIDQVIDSILIKHEKEISKDLLNFKIDVSKNYTLRGNIRSEEHTSELQSRGHLVCRLLLEKKKTHRRTP